MSRHFEVSEPGPTVGGLLSLVTDFQGLGIELPDGDRFFNRVLDMPTPAAPELSGGLLHATDEQLLAYMRETAIQHFLRDRERGLAGDFAVQLAHEFASKICANADFIVDQLRPDFDVGVEQARQLRELGITEETTLDRLVTMKPAVITAWQNFQETALHLDQIGEARIDLSRVAGVPPRRDKLARSGPREFGLCFNVTNYDQAAAPWQRWVRVCEIAELVAPSTISPLRELAYSGVIDPDKLQAVAQDRHDRRVEAFTEDELAEARGGAR